MMLFNIIFRHLRKNRVYATISILGLAVGIACCVLIALHVFHEWSFDQYHQKKERIAKINATLHFNGEITSGLTSLAVGPTVQQEYPEVEAFVRFQHWKGGVTVSRNEQVFTEKRFAIVDSNVFDVFDIPLLKGDPKTALSNPKGIVISEAIAQKYFGDEDPLNQQLKINNSMVQVTGVMANQPKNTELQYDALGSIKILHQQARQVLARDWFRIAFQTFILFKGPVEEKAFEQKMEAFEEKYVQPFVAQSGIEASIDYDVVPLADLHFQPQREYDFPKANTTYLWVFSLMAIFILLIAAINYVNLSLAQSTKRAKEVGVRKTLGEASSSLRWQFIGESVIMTLLAIVVAGCLVELALHPFNVITQKSFTIQHVVSAEIGLTLLAIILLVGFLAGSYPAFIMSRFQPVRVLKGYVPRTGGVGGFRQTLIFLQFAFSLFMITGTLLVRNQMAFLQNINLGFDQENVLVCSLPSDTAFQRQVPVLLNRVKQLAGVEGVAKSRVPTGQTGELMFRIEMEGQLQERGVKFCVADEAFLDVMGIDLLNGRNFSKERPTDAQQAFIVNETGARQFGWGDEALGKRVQWGLNNNNTATNDGKIVGVVEDFNFLSLHNPLEPLIILFSPKGSNTLTVRLAKGDYSQTLARLEAIWQELGPQVPFDYQFLDDTLDQNYQTEKQMQQVFGFFAIVSLVLAVVGLFALISFSIETRTKEIGIRKIVGASWWNLAWIISRNYFVLLGLAFVLTIPVNFYLLQRWLESFAYQMPVPWLSFLSAFLIAVASSVVIVAWHTLRISRMTPVAALRHE